MPHRRKPPFAKRAAVLDALCKVEPTIVHTKRAIADLLAAYQASRCGRSSCARAGACVEPGAPCFDENRENMHDGLLALAVLADPDATDDDEDDSGDSWFA